MNTAAIKKYAPKARLDFIQAVTQQAAVYGISDQGIAPSEIKGDYLLIGDKTLPASVAQQRNQLITQVQQSGFQQTMEAVAYGWFNRFIAIRYMELHDYLEHGRRVLSHPTQSNTFQILEECADIDLPNLDKANIIELKLDGTQDERLYRELLLAQCHALHAAMPFLFEALNSATELLLPDNLTQTDSIIHDLVTAIPEADWQNVEIVGWLYQFYIAEKKDQVIGKVVKSEDIPAATQLFTPNWIVKYMVQNSVGAQWLATYPDSPLKAKMEYYIEPAEQTEEVQQQLAATTPDSLDPETITIMDPACGSGHILVEAYSLMREIYLERGYRERDIPLKILQNNLFGLDIDDRAAQLSGFALMMKARKDDRRIFSRLASHNITINVLALQDSKQLDLDTVCDNLPLGDYGLDREIMYELIQTFEQAKTFGSLTIVPKLLTSNLNGFKGLAQHTQTQIFEEQHLKIIKPLIYQLILLSQKYDAVIANPPYMGSKGMNVELDEFVKEMFPTSKSDLFAVFMQHGFGMLKYSGFNAQINMQAWMFISRFKKLRKWLLETKTLLTMIHLGAKAFSQISGEIVQTTAWVMKRNNIIEYQPTFFRLVEGNEQEKQDNLLARKNRFATAKQEDFQKIPNHPVGYWASKQLINSYTKWSKLKDIANCYSGLITKGTSKFIRYWFELDKCSVNQNCSNYIDSTNIVEKWVPLIHQIGDVGFTGSSECVVYFENGGDRYKKLGKGSLRNNDEYFKPCISWADVGSGNYNFGSFTSGFVPNSTSHFSILNDPNDLYRVLGLLNSSYARFVFKLTNPTIHLNPGEVGNLPIPAKSSAASWSHIEVLLMLDKKMKETVETHTKFNSEFLFFDTLTYTKDSAKLTKAYLINKLSQISECITINENLVSSLTNIYDEKLNYCYQFDDENIDTTVKLVSYAIGCMMGRYSLDKEGLIYAHSGNKDFDSSQYTTFPADDDGIIPLTDREWFDDDATNRFKEFISVTWDKDHLHENLSFVADNLKPKRGEDALDTIRRYMSTGFFKDHLKTYKKRPIYWLFSSGKEKAFEALVYLHRYNEGTLARMRTEYVIPLSAKLNAYEEQLKKDQEASSSAAETKRLEKDLSSIHKKQTELANFDEKLRHYADQRISLDLDDGVKVNYGKFGDLLSQVKAIHGKVVA